MRHVIIGNSAAGTQAAETIRRHDPDSEIVIISDEGYPAYSRCLLPDYLAGTRSQEAMFFRSRNFYKKYRLTAKLGKKAVDIDTREKRVLMESGEEVAYDRLLIATGSSAVIPPIPGIREEGIHPLRNLEDAQQIKETARRARRAVVIGGGFIGLEAAYALYSWGMEVTVVEKFPQILPGQFDAKAAAILQNDMQAEGIRIITGNGIQEIIGPSVWKRLFGSNGKGVVLESGERLKCELIVVATGVRPNVAVADGTGVAVNRGISVDEYLETSVPGIYAAGDVVETVDVVSGKSGLSPIWPNAVVQGRIAGLNMLGKQRKYSRLIGMQNAVEFREVPAMAIGLTQAPEGAEQLIVHQPQRNRYQKLVLQDDVILGMILVGNINQAGLYAALIKNKVQISRFKHRLLRDDFGYSSIVASR